MFNDANAAVSLEFRATRAEMPAHEPAHEDQPLLPRWAATVFAPPPPPQSPVPLPSPRPPAAPAPEALQPQSPSLPLLLCAGLCSSCVIDGRLSKVKSARGDGGPLLGAHDDEGSEDASGPRGSSPTTRETSAAGAAPWTKSARRGVRKVRCP
jgi:hypothetical protein